VERGGEDAVDGRLHLRVGHDDDVVLRSAERLHTLPVLRRGGIDVVRHRGRAHERDTVDPRVLEDPVDGVFAAIQEVDDARGNLALVEQLEDQL
jgi:hypothetical protein